MVSADLGELALTLRALLPAPLYHAAPLRHCMTVIKLGGTANNGFCTISPQEWLAHPGSVGRATQSIWRSTASVSN